MKRAISSKSTGGTGIAAASQAPATQAGPASRAPRKRTPGRRPTADAIDLRERLLDAALACFAAQGIGATSLRDIARRAGVTPALVHYYYGDKLQLQQAVVAERLWPVMAQVHAGMGEADDDVAAMVTRFVAGITHVVAAHPWLPTLWVREILCEGGALRGVMIERIGPLLPHLLVERFAAAQRAGRLNPGLDPRLMVVSMVGLTMFPLASAPIWQQLFGAGELGADAVQRHALALLTHGLELGHE
ncbi:MAG: TetR/AcrR family transcriptional regulator [Stenotrophomonas nitritireducens]|uniref:TetR/AcrR family transcriptional regulator n=1 Tax=Stenotrophomonas TaxID=40323 RepID=UPI0009E71370|nr:MULTISPECIES: TetR/AcrR family transcriptional regulator [Stenotrophomonas]MBN8769735.1 TetR/AcrR family transcriptional regulator [Stenotrophomonas sp.]MBN8790803.1 TetR/AcrR family transcriptional regulator [Stenotrophomonas nitritireducens]